MSDELSEEAMKSAGKEIVGEYPNYSQLEARYSFWDGWRECRRRADVLIEKTFQDGVRKGCEISEVWTDREQVIETERRKAFEAGWMARLVRNRNFDEAYRAYTEAAKEEK